MTERRILEEFGIKMLYLYKYSTSSKYIKVLILVVTFANPRLGVSFFFCLYIICCWKKRVLHTVSKYS